MSNVPLLKTEASHFQRAAFLLSEAMNGESFEAMPKEAEILKLHARYRRLDFWVPVAIGGLLALTVFETPLWCNEAAYWRYMSARERCAVEGKAPVNEVIMSGVPLLPIGTGIVMEICLLGVVLASAMLAEKLNDAFKPLGKPYRAPWKSRLALALCGLAFLDILRFIIKPNIGFRLAPYIRFALSFQVPSYLRVFVSFYGTAKAIAIPSLFLVGSVILFAWLGALFFDDLDFEDKYGVPVNQGFENFGNALYTSFLVSTTANLPDVMVPTFDLDRGYIFLWMAMLLVSICIFMQVILAAVYSHYQEEVKEAEMSYLKKRAAGVVEAFKLLAKPGTKSGHSLTVDLNDMSELAKNLKEHGIRADAELVKFIFNALDDDGNGILTSEEFYDMCDVLQYNFKVTKRDSALVQKHPDHSLVRLLVKHLDNDPGSDAPDFGYQHRFEGSNFSIFMNTVLGLNVVFVLLESWYDLRNVQEPSIFFSIDLFFSFVYLFEVAVKLCRWSFDEYWTSYDNRFDFVTSIILAVAGVCFLSAHVSKDVLRMLNLLRFIRLLKALSNIPAYQKVCSTIWKMVLSCKDILMMNFLVCYLWSALGLQLFGGELYEDNPAFKGLGLDYFDSHFQVYNFNDMLLALLTLFWFLITGWVDQVAQVCMALGTPYSMKHYLFAGFFYGFYVAAVLLAYNVFAAFSIDVYIQLTDEATSKSAEDVEKNMQRVRVQLAAENEALHFAASADLAKHRLYKDLLDIDVDAP
eukprot:CAMPEP_0178440972 /NCGR_PEP_ID=MMETSP0689_2-20121128/37178_1 /TAXON_ID=160604 /ORGANISM="Amphidinium massartii, Strain CS-259" /LENGTH=748 /DNA_ID=CAMNT_0020064011 /DNA_START=61 /DNA_END=2304 /DNA_ORIENTATION=-